MLFSFGLPAEKVSTSPSITKVTAGSASQISLFKALSQSLKMEENAKPIRMTEEKGALIITESSFPKLNLRKPSNQGRRYYVVYFFSQTFSKHSTFTLFKKSK